MKIKVACVLFLGMSIMGYYSTNETVPVIKVLSMSQEQFTISQSHLKIINAVSTVRRGGTGIITIQGVPNTLYNIKTSYKLGNKTIPVIQWRTTDVTGVTTFNWIVGMKSVPGTYSATISGGDEIINTKHTVIP